MLYRSQMTTYARHQLDAARQMLREHRADATGCCVSCGRPTPCPDQVTAEKSSNWYQSWLVPQSVFGSEHRFTAQGSLVRPYVRNAGRH
ncbi:MAG: hypothetical protein QOH97_5448 [Actinoplanes sp.]|jgi:hypothetical protein|nr:hypothetical protein [Actinoplanes sp.]